MNSLKLSLIIPAHNEEKNIEKSLQEVKKPLIREKIPYEIIVVNDSSKDKTAEIVSEHSKEDPLVKLVNRKPPSGLGRAIRSGLDAIEGDVVVIYMADLSDDPEDVVKYYRKIEEGYDCVFGSRFVRGSKVVKYPLTKLIVNRVVNTIIQLMFLHRHNDLTNAFKAYRSHVITDCGPYRASHFNITIEMSLSAVVRKYTIATVPINWSGRTWGSSNLNLLEMGRRYLSTLLKVFFERILISDDLMAERLSQKIALNQGQSGLEKRVEKIELKLQELEKNHPSRKGA